MIGDKIKTLRRGKKLTQEQLAEYMDVSPQAVSKWETGASSPDIDMLPRLAAFFRISLDDLLEYDRRRIDAEVEELVKRSVPLRDEPEKAEAFYRQALTKYPNNEVLLNCLLMVIPDDRMKEKIAIGEKLLDCSEDEEIRLDVLRLLALSCRRAGEQAMAEAYLARLPELYFLKTEIAAAILGGPEQAAQIEKTENICLWTLGAMLKMREEAQENTGEKERYRKLRKAFLEPFLSDGAFRGRAEKIARKLDERSAGELY